MKIGILTFHHGPNFGGFLQAWCLREAIEQFGHEVEIINYKNSIHAAQESMKVSISPRLDLVWQQLQKKKLWEKVYAKLVNGPPLNAHSDINWSSYDYIVVGSDVIWDYETEKFGNDSAYFGAVPGGEQVCWLSYAASCGRAGNERLSDDKIKGLKSFKGLGVRDVATQDLVRSVTGRESQIVVDPTWLADQEPEQSSDGSKSILAIYGYAKVSPEMVASIKSFAKKLGLEIVSYGFKHKWADRNCLLMTPFEWIEALREACCVITGTFHGTLYSLRLRKKFCTLNNPWISNKIEAPFSFIRNRDQLVSSPLELEKQLIKQFENGPTNHFKHLENVRSESHKYLACTLNSH